jgi:phosphoglycolate phosphatase
MLILFRSVGPLFFPNVKRFGMIGTLGVEADRGGGPIKTGWRRQSEHGQPRIDTNLLKTAISETMNRANVIFDLDGTLLDTLVDLAETSNEVLAAHQLPQHAIDDYRFLVGDGVRVLFHRAVPADRAADDQLIQTCVDSFQQMYQHRWDRSSHPYPGIPALLDTLIQRGIRMGVLSNKPQPFTELCVRKLLADWSFDAVFGQREGIPRKPDPAGVREILGAWGATPEQCVYVGDTNTDMQTGKAAGCFTVGVTWGFRPRQELQSAGADHLIDKPAELLSLFQ